MEEASPAANSDIVSPEGIQGEGINVPELEEEEEYGAAPSSLEDGGQPTIDELEEINLGTEDDPRPTFIAKALPEEEKSMRASTSSSGGGEFSDPSSMLPLPAFYSNCMGKESWTGHRGSAFCLASLFCLQVKVSSFMS